MQVVYRTFAALACAVALSLAMTAAAADQPDRFSIDRLAKFAGLTGKGQAFVAQLPGARDIISAGPHVVAMEDLDGDGQPEVILLARSPALCANAACSMIVWHKSAGGVETLFSGKVRVLKSLAITKETVNGYRAIATIDTVGDIAIDDSGKSQGSKRQLVYTMAQRAPTPAVSADAGATQAKDGRLKLETIVESLAQSTQQGPVGPWSALTRIPAVEWKQQAPIQAAGAYLREGSLSLDALARANVTWQGERDRMDFADVWTEARIEPAKFASMLKGQFSPSTKLTRVRAGCANKPEFANSAIYQAVLQDRKPAFLFVNTDPGVLNGITTVQIKRENVSSWQCDS